MRRYDAVVAGLGAMGAATLWRLAGAGLRVLGLDRFAPPHRRGSTHGHSRIIRQAYFEAPAYVPWVMESYQAWRALERAHGHALLRVRGGLMIGGEATPVLAGSLASARQHGLAHEILDASAIRRRFPEFQVGPDDMALLEPEAGVLDPETALRCLLTSAEDAGATWRAGVAVLGWEAAEGGLRVRTSNGDVLADRLVLAAGAWLPGLAGPGLLPLRPQRVVVAWFAPRDAAAEVRARELPVWIRHLPDGRQLYGLPDLADGRGIKAAFHSERRDSDPEQDDEPPSVTEVDGIRTALEATLPGLCGPAVAAETCRYTSTPDGHFLIDWHPDGDRVLVLSACSGHGFKFAPAVGRLAAELVRGGPAILPPAAFQLGRFPDITRTPEGS